MISVMTCAEAAASLGASLDGEVGPGLAASLGDHLASCPACRERFARESRFESLVAHALRSATAPAQDDAAWAQALQRAMAPASSTVAPAPWWAFVRRPSTPSQLRWVALVASLALLATFSLAGLGLRRSFHAGTPSATDPQHALPVSPR